MQAEGPYSGELQFQAVQKANLAKILPKLEIWLHMILGVSKMPGLERLLLPEYISNYILQYLIE